MYIPINIHAHCAAEMLGSQNEILFSLASGLAGDKATNHIHAAAKKISNLNCRRRLTSLVEVENSFLFTLFQMMREYWRFRYVNFITLRIFLPCLLIIPCFSVASSLTPYDQRDPRPAFPILPRHSMVVIRIHKIGECENVSVFLRKCEFAWQGLHMHCRWSTMFRSTLPIIPLTMSPC